MSIGISIGTALAISTAAGVGASIYGASKQAGAAKDAAAQQQQSAQQALALQKQMYETTRGDLAPYREQGGQGLTALTSFLGLPATGGGAAPAAPAPDMARPLTGARPPTLGTPVGTAVPRGTAANAAAPLAQGSAYAPPVGAPSGGGVVMLRAPNGQTRAVPADQVDYYVARGATRG